MFATTYPRIRVSTSIYTWIISRGGVLFPTTYPRIRVSTSIYTWIISRGGVVFATTYTRIRVSTSIYTWIIFRRGVVFATTYPCIRSLQGSSFEMAGYSAVTPVLQWFSQIQFACFGSTKSTIVYVFVAPLADHRQLIVQYIFL